MRVLSILTVSAACAVSASASSLRQLKAMASPPLNCIIENGFDYVGNDISNAQGAVTSCCSICASVLNCTAWSWSNHNGGTCWLKSGRGDVVVNPNVKSALQAYTKPPFCVYQNDVDFVGNDLARVSSPNVEGCCDICQKYAGCRAYSWSDHLGGSCWLKSKAGQAVYKAGVKSANAYPDIPASCPALEYGLDFVGNDIANKPGIAPGDCCEVCKNTNGCRSFSWSDHNGGTCWLKSAKGSTVYKAGVTSAQVFPNPPPQCSLENNVDYVGNDIGNVANKDAAACCGICRDRNGCHAFSWSDYNGGTCWLKSGKGATATKAGVKSAVLQ